MREGQQIARRALVALAACVLIASGALQASRMTEGEERKALYDRMAGRVLPQGWTDALPTFPADAKGVASRAAPYGLAASALFLAG